MKSDKPMLPATPVEPPFKGYAPCYNAPKGCKYPGRLPLAGLDPKQLVCVECYSRTSRRWLPTENKSQ